MRFYNSRCVSYGLSPLIGQFVKEPIEIYSNHQVRYISKNKSVFNAQFFGAQPPDYKRRKLIKDYKDIWLQPHSKQDFTQSLKRQQLTKKRYHDNLETFNQDMDDIKQRAAQSQEEIMQQLQEASGEKMHQIAAEIISKHASSVQNPKLYEKSDANLFKGTQLAQYAEESALV